MCANTDEYICTSVDVKNCTIIARNVYASTSLIFPVKRVIVQYRMKRFGQKDSFPLHKSYAHIFFQFLEILHKRRPEYDFHAVLERQEVVVHFLGVFESDHVFPLL